MPPPKSKDHLQEAIINSLNPVQENVLKTVQKVQKQQVEEAMQQGVPAEHILQQSGIDLGRISVQAPQKPQVQPEVMAQLVAMLSQAQQAPQTLQAPQEPKDPNKRTLIGNILNTLGNVTGINPMNEAVESLRLQNTATRQKIAGEEPIQPIQKLNYGVEVEKLRHQMDKDGRLDVGQLNTQYEKVATDFSFIRDKYASIQQIAQTPNPEATDDVALIYNFIKMQDPTSTVLQGEQATAENTRGIAQSFLNLYNRATTGKKLTPEQRANFLKTSQTIFKSKENQFSKASKEFEKLGIQNQVDPKKFMRDVGLASGKQEKPRVATVGRFQVQVGP